MVTHVSTLNQQRLVQKIEKLATDMNYEKCRIYLWLNRSLNIIYIIYILHIYINNHQTKGFSGGFVSRVHLTHLHMM